MFLLRAVTRSTLTPGPSSTLTAGDGGASGGSGDSSVDLRTVPALQSGRDGAISLAFVADLEVARLQQAWIGQLVHNAREGLIALLAVAKRAPALGRRGSRGRFQPITRSTGSSSCSTTAGTSGSPGHQGVRNGAGR